STWPHIFILLPLGTGGRVGWGVEAYSGVLAPSSPPPWPWRDCVGAGSVATFPLPAGGAEELLSRYISEKCILLSPGRQACLEAGAAAGLPTAPMARFLSTPSA